MHITSGAGDEGTRDEGAGATAREGAVARPDVFGGVPTGDARGSTGASRGAVPGPVSGAAGALSGVPAAASAAVDRRTAFRAVGAAGVAAAGAGALIACGSEGSDAVPFAGAEPMTVPVADVEVGSGMVVDQTYVVAQPRAGEFYAYSSVCPHQGCQVRQVTEADINCPCHGSKFAVEDGSVLTGPAESPLPKAEVAVEGDALSISPAVD